MSLQRANYQAFRDFNARLIREREYQEALEWAAFFDTDIEFPVTHRPHIPVAVRREVCERDGYQCVFCGSGYDLALDHIEHFSAGGPDTVDNLRVLCMTCNRKRGNRQ